MLIVTVLIILVIFLIIILAIVPLDFVDIRWKTLRAMYKLPGPISIPIIGMGWLTSFVADTEMMPLLELYYKRFSRIIAAYIDGTPLVLLQKPEDLEVILGSVNHIKKGPEYNLMKEWLAEGLLTSTGEKWHHRRKILTPAFHFSILEDNLQSLNRHSRYLLRNILKTEGKPFNVDQLVSLCTLDVICETAMGFSLNFQDNQASEYVSAVKRISAIIVNRIRTIWLRKQWIFQISKKGKEFFKSTTLLHNFTEKIIRERRSDYNTETKFENSEDAEFIPRQRKAFLDILLELDKKCPNTFTNQDIREEVDTFMFGGHDTTSAAIHFALFSLGLHPEIQDKVYQELYDIFGDSDRAATSKDLHEMHYLDMVIKETLRLYPSVPYISRQIAQDVKLAGDVLIPEGAVIVMLPYFLHRDPRNFTNPEVFDPERFTLENCKKRHPYSYIPFSAGPRNCIGQKFAMMELKVVLSTIIRYLKIEPVTKIGDFTLFPFLILRTAPHIQIKAVPRNADIESKIEVFS